MAETTPQEEAPRSLWQRAKGLTKAGVGGGLTTAFVLTFPVSLFAWGASAAVGGVTYLAGKGTGSETLQRTGQTLMYGPISCAALAAEGATNFVTGKPTGKWGPTTYIGNTFKGKRDYGKMAKGIPKMIVGAFVGALHVVTFPALWIASAVVGATIALVGKSTGSEKIKKTGYALMGGPITCATLFLEGGVNLITGRDTGTWGPSTWIGGGANPTEKGNSPNIPTSQQNINYKQDVQKVTTLEQAKEVYNKSMKKENAFKVSSNIVNQDGDRVIVYKDPRDENNTDKNVTYIIGKDGQLKEIIPGGDATCTLPPIEKSQGGFASLELKNGQSNIIKEHGKGDLSVAIRSKTSSALNPNMSKPTFSPALTPNTKNKSKQVQI